MRSIFGLASLFLALSSPLRMTKIGASAFTIQRGGCTSFIPRHYHASSQALHAKPKQGSVIDSYRTVSVNCAKCGERQFRYKKKNGTKSNLVKCYVERIAEDSAGLPVLAKQESSGAAADDFQWECPSCQTQFARLSLIHGRPALKIVGGKVRMTKQEINVESRTEC